MEKKAKGGVFGSKGWLIVGISAVYFWLGTSLTSDGLNSLLPYFTETLGCTTVQLTLWGTVGGWLTFIGNIFFGRLVAAKNGAKPGLIIGLLGNLVAVFILMFCNSVTMYAIGMVLYLIATCGVSGIGCGSLGSNWFPTKKGQYMGVATMGIAFSGAFTAIILNTLLGIGGLKAAMGLYAVVIVIALIVTVTVVKSNPEEAGAYPDNDPTFSMEELKAEQAKREEYKKSSPWTTKAILTNKEFWHMALGWSLLGIGATGLISQLVMCYIEYGQTPVLFGQIMAICLPWGLFTSWACGKIDDVKGTKFASICCAVMLLCAQLSISLLGKNVIFLIIGTALLNGTLSAFNNTAMSITQQKFGRYDFANAWTWMSVVNKILSLSGLLIVSAIAAALGSYQKGILAVSVFTIASIILMATFDQTCVGRNHLD